LPDLTTLQEELEKQKVNQKPQTKSFLLTTIKMKKCNIVLTERLEPVVELKTRAKYLNITMFSNENERDARTRIFAEPCMYCDMHLYNRKTKYW
jgi:hypothetical protein